MTRLLSNASLVVYRRGVTSGSIRNGICVASAITVVERSMPSWLQHLVDDALEVGVGARDDAGPHVAGAGDRERLQHLGDLGEVRGDGLVPGALADLQGQERRHREARAPRGRGPAPSR